MPRKRKSSLSRVSSQRQAKRLAISLESLEDAELRRQEKAERQAVFRASETSSQRQQRRLEQAERQATLRAIETLCSKSAKAIRTSGTSGRLKSSGNT
ncbi:unnamed protein product [Parnassius apollo]|uniref:(apollo) hypothetical protein n=1 Tax=Parnassius apollo TaxID=110799 RepID=A0A8S3WS89_PARAO|nr:unnamed protein product [Parnassius apollo]